ncbi:hypothetical protein [Spirobacillus cienkowskii]|uniref:hypothetical protein n=1 Tax=Spirobacillus cienkowskii TaxID=495820 RepID=UPI0030D18AA2
MRKVIYKVSLLNCFIFETGMAQETSSALIELNPLLMVNQGFGINYELNIFENHFIGTDIEFYKQNPFSSDSVQTKREIFSIVPKWHYYIFSKNPLGLFIGLKARVLYMSEEVRDNFNKIEREQINFSPAFQFGYRFTNKSGLTFGIYIGAGMKLFYNPLNRKDLYSTVANNPEWIKAMNYLEKNNSVLTQEFGLTLGYIF